MKQETVKFVSLGPGEPELITIKGLRALKDADCIYCPGTEKGGKIFSRSKNIIEELDIESNKMQVFPVPMKEDGQEAKLVYTKLAKKIVQRAGKNEKIVVVANGHNGLYSSGFYISEFVQNAGFATELIAGIPAFIGAGALASLHIAKNNEPLLILPKVESAQQLKDFLSQGCQVVLMKPSKSEKTIKSIIKEHTDIEVHYFENVGVKDKEYYSLDKTDILGRKFPYFSLFILKTNPIER